MMRIVVISTLVNCLASSLHSYYCPGQHRHLGHNILRLHDNHGESGLDPHLSHNEEDKTSLPLPQPSFWFSELRARDQNETEPRLICPSGCVCKPVEDEIKVHCEGHYQDHFPLDGLPLNTTSLVISPSTSTNSLTLSPSIRRLRRLRELEITHSNIPIIGKRTLYGLSGLTHLNLSYNSISHLIDANFDGLNSLSSLALSNNNIKSITSAAFHHLQSLENLFLAQNSLKELAPRIFYKLNLLKRLDLSHNNLLLVDEEVLKDIRNIQHLTCSNCGLYNFRVGFSLRFLRALELSDNKVETLDDIEPHIMRGLAQLQLSGNRLTKVTKLENDQMESLDLSRNNISLISACAFCSCLKLTKLDLSQNFLTHIDRAFGDNQYEEMKFLDLSRNMIHVEEITKVITKFPRLESLSLSGMNMVTLHTNMFAGKTNLRHLNLSLNYLVSLESQVMESLPRLEYLDISHNKFMGLDAELLRIVDLRSDLKMVSLAGNPWQCDKCNILPLKSWLESSLMYWGGCFSSAEDQTCLTCSSPSYLAATPIKDLVMVPDCSHSNPDFRSLTHTLTQISQYLAITILLVVLIILAIILVSRYRHYGVYLTGEEEDKENKILTDPINILGRETNSYIDLRYPTLTKD